MDLKTRKRLSLLILLLGLPGYIVIAWIFLAWLNDSFGRLPVWAEFLIITILGVIWILPLKRIFTGIGRSDE